MMTMRQQCCYLVLLCLFVISGQITNMLIQAYYVQLSINKIFIIWWLHHLLEMLLHHVAFNIWHFYDTAKNFPELNGHVARVFPGKESPYQMKIIPREATITNNEDSVGMTREYSAPQCQKHQVPKKKSRTMIVGLGQTMSKDIVDTPQPIRIPPSKIIEVQPALRK